ncbi:MAG: FecR domain-containing protein [Spirochaetes bacterium]|nr:FecR domain-containing protein [Spirochaetota bacterium]
MKKVVSAICLLFILSACSKNESKPFKIGLINFIIGKVYLIGRDGSESAAKIGLPLDSGMKIKTIGKDSVCEVYIGDNAIKLFGDSIVSVDVLAQDSESKSDNTIFNLEKGRIMGVVKNKLLKNDNFEVKTPTCTAAVRGTTFFVSQEKNSSSVSCIDGKVEVSSKKSKPVIVEENERAEVSKTQKIKKSGIEKDQAAALKKDSEMKEMTPENKKVFEKIDSGDVKTRKSLRKNINDINSPNKKEKANKDKDGGSADVFFFKSND